MEARWLFLCFPLFPSTTTPTPFKRQPHNMVKHTQTIRLSIECVSPYSGVGA